MSYNGVFPTAKLGPLCRKIGSGATPRGGKETYLESGPFSLIRSQNIYNNRFTKDGLASISQEQADDLRNVEVVAGDVLLNITGDSVARCCQAPAEVLPARVNQHVAIIRPDSDQLDPTFLRYFLVSPQMQEQMLMLAGAGATRNALTKGMIENFSVPKPDVGAQRDIAKVLKTLDSKIESNQQMNETLEELATVLFKSLFIDTVADGLPEGWATRALYDCADYINGAAFRNEHFSPDRQGLPIVKIAELKDGITPQTKFTKLEREPKYRIASGEILFSWSGSPDTSIDTFVWTGGDGWLNQHIFKIQFKRPIEKFFVYYLLRHLKPEFIEIARNKQTTGLGHVTAQDLKRMQVAFPPDKLLVEFNQVTEPLFQKVFSNFNESRTLAELRDTLLPKLLSGEVRVTEAKARTKESVR